MLVVLVQVVQSAALFNLSSPDGVMTDDEIKQISTDSFHNGRSFKLCHYYGGGTGTRSGVGTFFISKVKEECTDGIIEECMKMKSAHEFFNFDIPNATNHVEANREDVLDPGCNEDVPDLVNNQDIPEPGDNSGYVKDLHDLLKGWIYYENPGCDIMDAKLCDQLGAFLGKRNHPKSTQLPFYEFKVVDLLWRKTKIDNTDCGVADVLVEVAKFNERKKNADYVKKIKEKRKAAIAEKKKKAA
uniref:Uncharacterized protein n=1 Tax=Chenopodium quinoa TaxID=63459 RepID=A0A803N4M4_CHEQI